ncbi:putative cyclase-domain-containing protein [Pestalotiopsis sp. NC0098]|nr:putative cyclase-domain-containing protein [Pestalotiopsis sp. NC0098]
MNFDPNSNSLPKRSELPQIPGAPKGAAWFWGESDELGRLNMLTPQRVAEASKLIREGKVINLNLPAHLPNPPLFGREPFHHEIKSLGPPGNDEILHFNSQSGSQWDGFRHVSVEHNGQWLYYNNTTREDIMSSSRIGVQAWCKSGVVGRGVLLDYWRHFKGNFDPNTRKPIAAAELTACAKAQGLDLRYGDILLIRTGWIETYKQMTPEQRLKLTQVPKYAHTFVGVDQSEEVADFLHDHYFSVVASDAPAFEVWPQRPEWNHHVNLLPLWGLPIGELWDLEALADVCEQRGQYEFFFASMPMNVEGSVGSYSNAMAIF